MRSNAISLIVAMLAGFAGGMLSQEFIRPAQAAATVQPVVTARDFRLVDPRGNVIAELAPSKTPIMRATLHINGYNGHFADLGATNLIIGGKRGGELGLGYVQDKNGQPTTTAIFFVSKERGTMALDADGPAINLYGDASSISLYDESGKQKRWTAP